MFMTSCNFQWRRKLLENRATCSPALRRRSAEFCCCEQLCWLCVFIILVKGYYVLFVSLLRSLRSAVCSMQQPCRHSSICLSPLLTFFLGLSLHNSLLKSTQIQLVKVKVIEPFSFSPAPPPFKACHRYPGQILLASFFMIPGNRAVRNYKVARHDWEGCCVHIHVIKCIPL